ncbi:hypothetical protein ACSMXM_05350 [Pacificimonas sp. ICDLI1SI03]
MTPLDRAARALAKAQSGTDDWDALDAELQDKLRDEARAVIEAFQEAGDKSD